MGVYGEWGGGGKGCSKKPQHEPLYRRGIRIACRIRKIVYSGMPYRFTLVHHMRPTLALTRCLCPHACPMPSFPLFSIPSHRSSSDPPTPRLLTLSHTLFLSLSMGVSLCVRISPRPLHSRASATSCQTNIPAGLTANPKCPLGRPTISRLQLESHTHSQTRPLSLSCSLRSSFLAVPCQPASLPACPATPALPCPALPSWPACARRSHVLATLPLSLSLSPPASVRFKLMSSLALSLSLFCL